MSQETFSEPTIEDLAQQVEEAREAMEKAKADLNGSRTQENEKEFLSRSEAWKEALRRYKEKRG